MRPRSWFLTPFVAVGTLASSLAAQEPPDRWRIEIEAGLNGASGNSSFSVLRAGTKVSLLQSEEMAFEAFGLVRYGKNEDEVIADDARAGMKIDLWPQAPVSPFVFGEWSRDGIRRLDARANGGVGGKRTLWSGDKGSASLSAAALFDYQNFTVDPGATTPGSETNARWSVLTRLQRQLSEGATFEHTLTFQPAFTTVSDYVLDVTHSVTTRLLGNVSLSVEHEYLRDSVPPPGAGADDQKFSVLLKMSF